MGKIDIEFRSKRSQRTVSCIEQGFCGAIIRRSEPFALEDSPERLGDIQMWTVRWKEKEIQPTFLPYWTEFPHEFASVDACIVKDNKSVFTDTERKSVKKVGNLVSGHILSCGESFISIVAVYHAENIESQTSFRWNIDILSRNCHPYGTYPSVQMWLICNASVSHPISTAPAMTHYRQLPDVISYFIFHVIFYSISCRFIYKRVARTISSINSSALRLMRIATAMSREVSSRGLSPI